MTRNIGLRKCIHCGKLVKGYGSVCPKCGKNVDKPDRIRVKEYRDDELASGKM